MQLHFNGNPHIAWLYTFLLHRLSYSDLNIKPDQSNSYNFAKTLFGEDNRLNISSSKSAPNPLAIALFCTKNNRKMLFGKKIANFSNLVFCDSLKYIQTDVGICRASNSVLLFRKHIKRRSEKCWTFDHTLLWTNLKIQVVLRFGW